MKVGGPKGRSARPCACGTSDEPPARKSESEGAGVKPLIQFQMTPPPKRGDAKSCQTENCISAMPSGVPRAPPILLNT